MTDDNSTPPEGRPIRDVTIGPDGVTRRGTFQSPGSAPSESEAESTGAQRAADDQVESFPPPKSAGAHAGVSGATAPTSPPPVSSTSHADVTPTSGESAEPASATTTPVAAPVSTETTRDSESSFAPQRHEDAAPASAPATPSEPASADASVAAASTDSRAEHVNRDESPSATHASAAPVVAPAPPLAEAEKHAPAGTVPVVVAGATGEVPRTIYVEAPTAPKKKGNRGVGILISLLATLVFTIVWAGVAAAVVAVIVPNGEFADSYGNFIVNPAAWLPVIMFFVGLVIVVSILNRAGWAWYIVGGLLVGLLAYVGYLGGALISVAGTISPAEVQGFLIRATLNPLAIAVGITAREVSIWTGAAIAARGRRVKARNIEAREQFDRESAERRAEYERVRAGFGAA